MSIDTVVFKTFRKLGADDADAAAFVDELNLTIDKRCQLHASQLSTRADVESVRREVAELKVEMVKWFVGTIIAVGGITAALLKIMN